MNLCKRPIILASLALLLGLCQLCFAIDMKVDRVTINQNIGGTITWADVTFQDAFDTVPIVVVLPSDSNTDPATVRIRDVTTEGFSVGVVESQSTDGFTTAMTVDYFAAEAGTYNFPGATRIGVGAFSTTTQQGRYVSPRAWDDINFATSFGSPPAVIAQVQTVNSQPTLDAGILGNPFLEVAIDNVTSVDMDIALERAETSTGALLAETIGYVAMESGDQVSIGGATIQALLTSNNILGWDNGCYNNNFVNPLGAIPLVVASQNSRDGGDGGWVRRCSVSAGGIGLTVDEDQANDSERAHTTEEAGVLAISAPFHGTRNGRELEAGSVTIPSTAASSAWTTVNFPTPFSALPRIFPLPTSQGSPPAALRIRNVSTTGFDIAAFQPSGGFGSHPEMDVDYVAIIPGEHTLANGDIFEVGSIATNLYVAGTGGSTGTTTVNFNASFGGAPALLLQIQSQNNEPTLDPNNISSPWMVTATTVVTSSNATVAIERAEAIAGSISLPETIAYFAVRNGANDSLQAVDGGSVDYEALVTPNNIRGYSDGCFVNSFTDSYASPYAIATQSTRNGPNGGWLRRCSFSSTQIGLTVDEDQANDSERTHTDEQASVMVFSRAFEAEFNTLDHFSILHGGNGVTCEASDVTIVGHDASDLGVDLSGRSVDISANSVSPGWVASDSAWSLDTGSGTFSVTGPGTANYIFGPGESSAVFDLANTSVADIDIDVVESATGISDRDGVSEDPLLGFADTGLRFYNDANNDGDADGTDPMDSPVTSGFFSTQAVLRAVQTNPLTGACESRVTGTHNVEFAYECLDPLTCIRERDLNISSNEIPENDAGATLVYDTVALTFDAEGETSFYVQYFDVGRVRVHAQLSLPATGGDPALTLSGASNDIVFRPHDFVITAITDAALTTNPGTTISGAGFVASNTPFRIVVEARYLFGGLTPNYGNEIAAEGIVIRPVTLVTPSVGDLPPFISADDFSATAMPGEFENISIQWPEAGTVTLRAEVLDGDYMGAGNTAGTTSGNVGRFYPDHLQLLTQSVVNGCASGAFTYMSDAALSYTPIDIAYSVEALTAGGTRLQNYDDTYPVTGFSISAENSNDGNNLTSRLVAPTSTWVDGLYSVSGLDNGGFSRALSGTNEITDGPFLGMQLALNAASNVDDLNFLTAALNTNASTAGDCLAAGDCDGATLGSALQLYFSRLRIENAHGPESAALAVPFVVETWDPIAGFNTNAGDNCTLLNMTNIRFDGNNLSTDANRTVTIGGGTTTGSFASFTPGVSMNFVNGNGGLNFSPPGSGNSASFDVDIDLSDSPWLRFDWNQDGDAANNAALPSAQIYFGRYRGHDRVIYWREVLD